MSFKHPELLWALLALIIPIIVHLFQLRRFKKTLFTNVAFLEKAIITSRKSSTLKKWLLLTTRLFLITALVLAFAHPYLKSSKTNLKPQELIFYIDNSFSMQLETTSGTLLDQAKQNLAQNLPPNYNISLFTNDNSWKNKTLKQLKNDLLNISFSSNQFTYDEVILKASQLFSDRQNTRKKLIIISEFQKSFDFKSQVQDQGFDIELVQLQNQKPTNIAIDSIYTTVNDANTLDLNVNFSGIGTYKNVPVSFYQNNNLSAKGSVSLEEQKGSIKFNISKDKAFQGKIAIVDQGLSYDNELYFNLGDIPKIKVLVIYDKIVPHFLKRIYTSDEFELNLVKQDQVNFSQLTSQHAIVLYELDLIKKALHQAISDFASKKGHLIIVPHAIFSPSLNNLLKENQLPTLNRLKDSVQKITKIHFEHPLFQHSPPRGDLYLCGYGLC
jgi:hypothetical protein